ncbi:uncharacterized protein TNCV_956941 [Trichonephila clavipes]|nr:uncharacterized protein TNCV_956941 [Trichonephila clavipes]
MSSKASAVDKVKDSWPACHEFEPSAADEPPCRGMRHAKSVERAQTSSRWCGSGVIAVAEWSRYRIVAGIVTSSSSVPLKTRRVGQRCTLNLMRAQTSSRWCGVVVRRGGASSGVFHVP